MQTRTVFLAWQDKKSRLWFPVGRLDAKVRASSYCFRYTEGASRAEREAGFPLLIAFPDLRKAYWSSELFPVFQNRVMNRARPDFADYLRQLDLPVRADPLEILSVNGGSRVTDTYEVFPKLDKNEDGSFACRFFLHGWRYVEAMAQSRLDDLTPGEELHIKVQHDNPVDGRAVQILTTDCHMIGWAPRYLVSDLAEAMTHAPDKYKTTVVRINPQPAPSKQRVLIEMTGSWGQHEPMSNDDFMPLVPDTT